MNTPTIAVVYFGNCEGKLWRFFMRWIDCFHKCGTRLPVRLITDVETFRLMTGPQCVAPFDGDDLSCIFDPMPSVIRPPGPDGKTNIYDYKAALVCSALLKIRGPLLLVDADTELLKDPALALAGLATLGYSSPLMMARDCGEVVFRMPYDFTFHELNCGVIWFGGEDHSAMVDCYRNAFWDFDSAALDNSESRILENDAWSLAAARLNAPRLPAVLNWMGHFWGPNPDTIIRHLHGGCPHETEQVRPIPPPYSRAKLEAQRIESQRLTSAHDPGNQPGYEV